MKLSPTPPIAPPPRRCGATPENLPRILVFLISPHLVEYWYSLSMLEIKPRISAPDPAWKNFIKFALSRHWPGGRYPDWSSLASMTNFGRSSNRAMITWRKAAVGPPCFQREHLDAAADGEHLPSLTPSFARFPTRNAAAARNSGSSRTDTAVRSKLTCNSMTAQGLTHCSVEYPEKTTREPSKFPKKFKILT